VNVADYPPVGFDDEDYASEVLVIGAGEGEKMLRAHARVTGADRVRRVLVVQEKGIGRQATIESAAVKHAKRSLLDEGDVDELKIIPHSLAPLGSWENGDEVWLSGDSLWAGRLGQWVRVLSTTYTPEDWPGATVKVARADRV